MKTPRIAQVFLYAVISLSIAFTSSCKEDEEIVVPTPPGIPDAPDPTPYELNIPDYFPIFIVPEDNPTTVEGVELGKRIYYDKMLSIGGPMEGNACASCHIQATSFSSPGNGVEPLAHVNLNYTSYYLWNGAKEGDLEDVALFEITEFFQADVNLFRADTTYRKMFWRAFNITDFDEKDMAYALAQFFRSLNSFNSKFDRFWVDDVELSPLEEMGYLLFNTEEGDCFHCHSFPLTTDHNFHNTGLDSIFTEENYGRFGVTGDSADMGLFKTPTLRNVELTAPYMHDGRFATLEEVVEHYNSGVNHSATLDGIMTKPGKEYGLNLTPMEKAAIVAFLKTLTDTSFVSDPGHSSPF